MKSLKKKSFWIMLLIGFLMLNLNSANAQGKCKFYIDTNDPISGKVHKATNVIIKAFGVFSTLAGWSIDFDRMGTDYSIVSRLVVNSDTNESLEKGDSLSLKLESGKVLTIYAKNRIIPKKLESAGKVAGTNYISTYPISNEDFTLLSTDKILFFRINVGSLVFDQQINDKISLKLIGAATCIIQ